MDGNTRSSRVVVSVVPLAGPSGLAANVTNEKGEHL